MSRKKEESTHLSPDGNGARDLRFASTVRPAVDRHVRLNDAEEGGLHVVGIVDVGIVLVLAGDREGRGGVAR